MEETNINTEKNIYIRRFLNITPPVRLGIQNSKLANKFRSTHYLMTKLEASHPFRVNIQTQITHDSTLRVRNAHLFLNEVREKAGEL